MSTETFTTDADGREHHPAFALASLTRNHNRTETLFQSDLRHASTVTLTIETATRERTLGQDWVHPEAVIVEVEMSATQWAHLIAGSGAGTPVTLRRTAHDGVLPKLAYEPRTAKTREELTAVIDKTLAAARAALAELDRLEEAKAGVKERREARRQLHGALDGATSRAAFATQNLEKVADTVVQQARTDIEIFAAQAAQQHNLPQSPAEAPAALLLSAGRDSELDE